MGNSFENAKTTFDTCLFATVGFGSIKDFNAIEQWLGALSDGKYYEICFHPGTFDPDCKSSLNKDRENDVVNILKLNDILVKYDVQKASFCDII